MSAAGYAGFGTATRLDNTRTRSLAGRGSCAPQPMGTRAAQPDIPKGHIAERFRVDVLEKSGRWRWAMGQRSARRRSLGRQPRRRTEPARAGPTAARLRGALAAQPG